MGHYNANNHTHSSTDSESGQDGVPDLVAIGDRLFVILAAAAITLPEIAEYFHIWYMVLVVYGFSVASGFYVFALLHQKAKWSRGRAGRASVAVFVIFTLLITFSYFGGTVLGIASKTSARFVWPMILSVVTIFLWYRAIAFRTVTQSTLTTAPNGKQLADEKSDGLPALKIPTDLAPPVVPPTILPTRTPSQTTQTITETPPAFPQPGSFTIRRRETLAVFLGSTKLSFIRDIGGNAPPVGLFSGLSLRLANGQLIIDADVTDGRGIGMVRNNELVKYPDGWDLNSDDTYTEVVNEKYQPVFQILRSNTTLPTIFGIFSRGRPDGANACITPDGVNQLGRIGDIQEPLATFNRIFKYPSKDNPGSRATPTTKPANTQP